MNPFGCEPGQDHREGLADRLSIAQGMEDVGAEAGAGADGGTAGAAELLVVIAEGAGSEGGRLAQEAVGFDVTAERVVGVVDVHWVVPSCGRAFEGRALRPGFFSTILRIVLWAELRTTARLSLKCMFMNGLHGLFGIVGLDTRIEHWGSARRACPGAKEDAEKVSG